MADTYDDLADHYHLLFEEWQRSIELQASVLSTLLEIRCCISPPARLLDCACGIGTQSLGLAKLGFQVTGCDRSSRAIERARREAAARNLAIDFRAADMLDISALAPKSVDAVLCIDNALPHLGSDDELLQAAKQMHSKLRNGGWLIASIRDYDALLIERPSFQPPAFYSNEGRRRIVFQVWDWLDARRYQFHLYITRELASDWQTIHTTGVYRAITRDELTTILRRAGLTSVQWLLPSETGFYQPIVLAHA